jgi:hypothetical protein
MNTVSKFAIVAMAGLLVASFASPASAQDAARDAAIHKCIMQAQAQWPDVSNPGNQRNRTDAYRSCMQAEGQRP